MKKSNRRFREITKILLRHKLQKGLTPQKIRETIEDLGPTFIKIGQIMSTREDLIPKEYCTELEKLKENVKPLDFETVKKTIESELNKPITEVFDKIEEIPLGSASIGQVHKATLKDGTLVVIKVMRPGIYEIVEQDFKILKSSIKYLNLLTDISDVIDLNIIFDETWEAMKLEMDFIHEKENINIFTKNNIEYKYIKLPKTYDNLCTTHILVMEYIEGISIENTEALIKAGYDPKEICAKLVENFTTQVIDQGVFHADPHSGNILIKDGYIVWLDLGMIGIISKKDQLLYKKAIKAVINNDVYEIKNIVLTIGICRREINHAKLYQDVDNMLSKYLGMDINDMDIGALFEELMRVALNNGISMPKGMTLLGRSIVIMQRNVSFLDKEANLMGFFKDHVQANYKDEIDVEKKIPVITQKIYKSASKATEIPSQVYDLLNLTIKGQRHLNVEVTNLSSNVDKISKITNRLILGIIITGFTFALGLVLAALAFNVDEPWLKTTIIILVVLGLLLNFILIFILMIMIIKEKKK